MTAPGYPFSARDIFGDLRSRLAAEHRRPMSFERLAKMLGRSKSTTYNWFDIFHHPHVLGFLCLLERWRSIPAAAGSFPSARLAAWARAVNTKVREKSVPPVMMVRPAF